MYIKVSSIVSAFDIKLAYVADIFVCGDQKVHPRSYLIHHFSWKL